MPHCYTEASGNCPNIEEFGDTLEYNWLSGTSSPSFKMFIHGTINTCQILSQSLKV